jgi:hypothetical protein
MGALLVLFVLIRMLANAAEDVTNAVNKRPRRPRLTDRINNWKPSGRQRRYGFRRYLADLWADAWTDARASRDAKRAAAQQPAPAAGPAPAPGPQPQPARRPSPRPQPGPDPAAARPGLRLVPPATPGPATPPAPSPSPSSPSAPAPATPPAGNTQTPAQPAGKETPMATSGEITNVPAARSFAEAMLAHNKEVMGEIEHARASLTSRGISGPVIDELNRLREHYAQADGQWESLLKAIGEHERLAEQARATQGAAKDMSFYTNA